jgi:hypothetical protein
MSNIIFKPGDWVWFIHENRVHHGLVKSYEDGAYEMYGIPGASFKKAEVFDKETALFSFLSFWARQYSGNEAGETPYKEANQRQFKPWNWVYYLHGGQITYGKIFCINVSTHISGSSTSYDVGVPGARVVVDKVFASPREVMDDIMSSEKNLNQFISSNLKNLSE